jgi:hypothetical protein
MSYYHIQFEFYYRRVLFGKYTFIIIYLFIIIIIATTYFVKKIDIF